MKFFYEPGSSFVWHRLLRRTLRALELWASSKQPATFIEAKNLAIYIFFNSFLYYFILKKRLSLICLNGQNGHLNASLSL
jgi:hypothetical protein